MRPLYLLKNALFEIKLIETIKVCQRQFPQYHGFPFWSPVHLQRLSAWSYKKGILFQQGYCRSHRRRVVQRRP